MVKTDTVEILYVDASSRVLTAANRVLQGDRRVTRNAEKIQSKCR
ncbi:hypothetical protein LCGC14_0876830 [marine sediment metagenome]|uniref:Uncharacterized protein n=1 Tax=marine sediment metagenome TaxID=412755 RepID=A0A0F9P309_9ZZZZ